jgi:hypothetical protein
MGSNPLYTAATPDLFCFRALFEEEGRLLREERGGERRGESRGG